MITILIAVQGYQKCVNEYISSGELSLRSQYNATLRGMNHEGEGLSSWRYCDNGGLWNIDRLCFIEVQQPWPIESTLRAQLLFLILANEPIDNWWGVVEWKSNQRFKNSPKWLIIEYIDGSRYLRGYYLLPQAPFPCSHFPEKIEKLKLNNDKNRRKDNCEVKTFLDDVFFLERKFDTKMINNWIEVPFLEWRLVPPSNVMKNNGISLKTSYLIINAIIDLSKDIWRTVNFQEIQIYQTST